MHLSMSFAQFETPASIKIGENSSGKAIYARQHFDSGEIIFPFGGKPVPLIKSSALGLQIEDDLFLTNKITDLNRFDDFVNHSCNPNCRVHFADQHPYLMAIRDIKPGDELTFNYNTTEWDMIEQEIVLKEPCTFECRCGFDGCYGTVAGFRHLTVAEKLKLLPYLSTFLLSKLKQEVRDLSAQFKIAA